LPGEPRRALVIAPEPPYPMTGGGALRTASLIHWLSRERAVDLVLFRQIGSPDAGAALPAGLLRRVATVDLPCHGRSAPARAARNLLRIVRGAAPLADRFSGFEAALERAIGGERYEIGVVEHSWCAGYWPQVAAACRRTALDLHNIESDLHARFAESEGRVQAFAHRTFARAALSHERRWLPCFHHVLAASDTDAARVRAIAPGARVSVYPNAIRSRPLPPRAGEHVIVFSGNLEYHPNAQAVRFFRREVWPLLRARWPELVWRLVGRGQEAVARYTAGDPRIQVTGPVEDGVPEIARAAVAVVPLLAGSGTRLKILEAWSAGTPVVSTTIGAEGLRTRHGEHLLIADGAGALAEAVSRLLACPDLGRKLAAAGRILLEKEFTWEAAWRTLPF
jgi:polysaccharide biosynthesis protein PslH